jgi:hypothetical protein
LSAGDNGYQEKVCARKTGQPRKGMKAGGEEGEREREETAVEEKRKKSGGGETAVILGVDITWYYQPVIYLP